MKRLQQCAASLTLLLALAAPGWAAPRVALVIPISGNAELGGAKLSAPKIAEEGQKLSLQSGAEVRVQLLGSSKEKVLKGATSYTISKAGLEKEGASLDRGKVAVSSEIGNLSRAGAGTARPATYRPVGLVFDFPPVLQGDRWVAPTRTPIDKIEISEKSAITVTITDLTDPSRNPLRVEITKPINALAFLAKDLSAGHQYRMDVQRGSGELGYHREFRILTPEEQQTLGETEKVLRVSAITSDELPTLVRLASLYHSFDQTEKMAEVLEEAVHKPAFQTLDKDVQTQLIATLNRARNSLDLENYPAPAAK